jgi:hypothetical protein
MKSKLMMLILAGGLAFSAGAPSAMAKGNQVGPVSHSPVAVSKKSAAKAASKRGAQVKTAIPTKDGGKCTISPGRAVC